MGTSGKLSVLPTLVPKLLTWSAGSCSAAQPCPSLEEVTLEKGWVPSGMESRSVWGMNPSSPPAPGGRPGTSPAPTQTVLLSAAQVRTQGGVLNTGAVLGAGEQGRDLAGLGVRPGGVMLSSAVSSYAGKDTETNVPLLFHTQEFGAGLQKSSGWGQRDSAPLVTAAAPLGAVVQGSMPAALSQCPGAKGTTGIPLEMELLPVCRCDKG